MRMPVLRAMAPASKTTRTNMRSGPWARIWRFTRARLAPRDHPPFVRRGARLSAGDGWNVSSSREPSSVHRQDRAVNVIRCRNWREETPQPRRYPPGSPSVRRECARGSRCCGRGPRAGLPCCSKRPTRAMAFTLSPFAAHSQARSRVMPQRRPCSRCRRQHECRPGTRAARRYDHLARGTAREHCFAKLWARRTRP